MKRLLSIITLCLLTTALFAQQTYTLSLRTVPQAMAEFVVTYQVDGEGWEYPQMNGNTVQLPANCDVEVNIYDIKATSWVQTDWRVVQGNVGLSVDRDLKAHFTMPAGDVELVAVMEYNPGNPDLPNSAGGWYPDEGFLVIDYLNNRSLMSLVHELIPGETDNVLVRSILVGGYTNSMVSYDLSADRFPNLERIDLSRLNYVYPWSDKKMFEINDVSFNNLPCKELLLPENIEYIGGYAFEGTFLESLTMYAITPPRLYMEEVRDDNWNVIGRRQGAFPSSRDMIVYVPEASLPLYQSAEGWNEFDLQPIVEDAADITVNVNPLQGSLSEYSGMTLELLNVKNLWSRSMLISNRQSYQFATLPKNTQYLVRMLSRTGSVVGQVENVYLGEENLSVELKDLKKLCNVSLQVTEGSTAVDAQKYSVLWLDQEGRVMSRSGKVDGIVEGESIQALITLTDPALKANYRNRDTIVFKPSVLNPTLNYKLKPVPTYRLTSQVLRADGQYLGRHTVRQTIYRVTSSGNEFVRELTFGELTSSGGITSGAIDPLPEGVYDVSVRVENTDLGTVSQRISLYSDQTATFRLTEASGSTIRMSWRHYGVASLGELAEDVSYDDRQITEGTISIRDITDGVELKNFSVQPTGIIRLQEQLEPGTRLEVTLGAQGNRQFAPVSQMVTVGADGNAELSIITREYGSLYTSFRQTECSRVIVKVFDALGQLVASHLSDVTNEHTFTRLRDGSYKVVYFDGSGNMSNAMTSMADVEKYLVEGRDYSVVAADVISGITFSAIAPFVPAMGDDISLYTDGRLTVITPKRQSLLPGLYQTICLQPVFRPAYKGRITQLKAVFNLPDDGDMHFVSGSVLLNSRQTDYTFADGVLTIPAVEDKGIRFCVMPTGIGEYSVSGKFTFLLDGEPCEQLLPAKAFTVEEPYLNVPQVWNEVQVPIGGTVKPGIPVTIVVNDEEVGTAMCNSEGVWHAVCPLSLTHNMAVNRIYAQYQVAEGFVVKTSVKEVLYNKNGIIPLKVTMSQASLGELWYPVVYDMATNTWTPNSYRVVNSAEYYFDIELNVTDTTNVDEVMLYVYCGKKAHLLTPKYNPQTGHWIASQAFDEGPTQVAVYVVDHTPKVLGESVVHDMLHQDEEAYDDYLSGQAEVQQIVDAVEGTAEGTTQHDDAILQLMAESGFYPDSYDLGSPYPNTDEGLQQWLRDSEKVMAELDSLLKVYNPDDPEWEPQEPTLPNQMGELMPGYTFSAIPAGSLAYYEARSRGENPEPLRAEGTDENEYVIACEDGSNIFCRLYDEGYTLVIPSENLQIKVDYSAVGPEVAAVARQMQDVMMELREVEEVYSELRSRAMSPNRADDDGFLARMNAAIDRVYEASGNLTKAIDLLLRWVEETVGQKVNQFAQGVNSIRNKTQWEWAVYWNGNDGNNFWRTSKVAQDQFKKLQQKSMDVIPKLRKLEERLNYWQGKMKAVKVLGAIMGGFSLIGDLKEFITTAYKIIKYYKQVPDPCPKDQANASKIKLDLVAKGTARIIQKSIAIYSDVTAIIAAIGGTVTAATGAGAALGWGSAMAIKIGGWITNVGFDWYFSDYFQKIEQRIKDLHCNCDPNDPNCDCPPGDTSSECCKTCCKGPGCIPPPPPSVTPIMDPSGFIYEAVASNRVPDALASVYFRDLYEDMYGDTHERVVLWDAEAFDQINPMLTDQYGKYGWDVPAGLWQVRVVKDGYLPTESEWLPVPPPQLDVNLAMVQPSAPVVDRVIATEQGVEVRFDKYMKPAQLTPNNIFLTRDGQQLEGTISLLDVEQIPDSTMSYARRVLFQPKQQLVLGQKVRLTVKAGIESYANVGMLQDFTQEFDVEQRVTEIVVDSIVGILYGEDYTLKLSALPAKAAAGKTILVSSLNSDVLQVKEERVTLDNEGRATLSLCGKGYGATALHFTLADDPEVEAYSLVSVRDGESMMTRKPTASLISGVEVKYGTTLRLSCVTPDAVIYYTTDGTCPCDNPNRLRYDGSIILTHDVTLKAVAEAPGYAESDVATFIYKVTIPEGIDQPEGDPTADPVFTIHGMKVEDVNTLQKGVYVRQGKKIVVK